MAAAHVAEAGDDDAEGVFLGTHTILRSLSDLADWHGAALPLTALPGTSPRKRRGEEAASRSAIPPSPFFTGRG
jgi:hypothetical protein